MVPVLFLVYILSLLLILFKFQKVAFIIILINLALAFILFMHHTFGWGG